MIDCVRYVCEHHPAGAPMGECPASCPRCGHRCDRHPLDYCIDCEADCLPEITAAPVAPAGGSHGTSQASEA